MLPIRRKQARRTSSMWGPGSRPNLGIALLYLVSVIISSPRYHTRIRDLGPTEHRTPMVATLAIGNSKHSRSPMTHNYYKGILWMDRNWTLKKTTIKHRLPTNHINKQIYYRLQSTTLRYRTVMRRLFCISMCVVASAVAALIDCCEWKHCSQAGTDVSVSQGLPCLTRFLWPP
jgi:hypothetical protein